MSSKPNGAVEILAAGRLTVTAVVAGRAAGTVASPNAPGGRYEVTAWLAGGACTCPSARFGRGRACKHVTALRLVTGLAAVLSSQPAVVVASPIPVDDTITDDDAWLFDLINR